MRQKNVNGAGVHATLEYLQPTAERPYTYMYPPPDNGPWQNADYRPAHVFINDARLSGAAASVDLQGYALVHDVSEVDDFEDRQQVVQTYYPEAARMAIAATGASRAFVFDHLLRRRAPGTVQAFGRRDGHRPGAAGRVHCDFTPLSAQRRLTAELGERAGDAVRRYSIVNLWRSIRHPVLDAPLALCDVRSVSPADLVVSDIYYPERAGEIYQVLRHERHDWSYFPSMTRDEVLIFKQFDSAPGSIARCTPHAAFVHPDAPPDAPPRESIEVRCLLIFD